MDRRDLTDQITTYPHVAIKGKMTIEEMHAFANEIRQHFTGKGINVNIYGDNSYCLELNGTWNVVMSWRGEREDKETMFGPTPPKGSTKMYTYTYIIIHGLDGNTYAGPLQNAEYIYDINHVRFSKETYPEYFSILDQFMKDHAKTKMIRFYPINNDYIRDARIKDYHKYAQIIERTNNEVASLTETKELYINRLANKEEEEHKSLYTRKINSVSETIESKIKYIEDLEELCAGYKECLKDYGVSI